MKRALITTLFNEENGLRAWWECILRQTVIPDEIVLVDGGSTDGTWEALIALRDQYATWAPIRIEQKRCNIAAGRNLAITLTDAEIIASNDAGSFPDDHWFEEITKPLLASNDLDVVGGASSMIALNNFQRTLAEFERPAPDSMPPEEVYPSSRCIAFRRSAWIDVGGYPEWLTLTAEDSLFNFMLHKVGKRFVYNSRAKVAWPMRESAESYFKMVYWYGYGAGEAHLYYSVFRDRLRYVMIPPLLLATRQFHRNFFIRYWSNVMSCVGWLKGYRKGHHPPVGWVRVDGVFLSPEAQRYLETRN